jgi:hypothetical protein
LVRAWLAWIVRQKKSRVLALEDGSDLESADRMNLSIVMFDGWNNKVETHSQKPQEGI